MIQIFVLVHSGIRPSLIQKFGRQLLTVKRLKFCMNTGFLSAKLCKPLTVLSFYCGVSDAVWSACHDRDPLRIKPYEIRRLGLEFRETIVGVPLQKIHITALTLRYILLIL
jgi:hypothetical protein